VVGSCCYQFLSVSHRDPVFSPAAQSVTARSWRYFPPQVKPGVSFVQPLPRRPAVEHPARASRGRTLPITAR
jgi:hypothetical protein